MGRIIPTERHIPSAAFFLAVLAIAFTYWIASLMISPGTSLDEAILFRPHGDSDYLPIVSALSRLGYDVAPMDYYEQWPTIAAIYREYSYQRTGMQFREDRFWETWPLRGTFPLGFSHEIGSLGFAAYREGRMVAYLAAQQLPDMPHLAVTEFAHLNDHPEAMLVLLHAAARKYLEIGGRRMLLHTGGQAPVLKLLEAQAVPYEADSAQGLMIQVTNKKWIRRAASPLWTKLSRTSSIPPSPSCGIGMGTSPQEGIGGPCV